MTRRVVEGCYARLCGLEDAAFVSVNLERAISQDFVDDYNNILAKLRANCADDFDGFDLPSHVFRRCGDPLYEVAAVPLRSKIKQLKSFLEKVHNASSKIVEVGSAYNLIRDTELKSRCADLLSAPDHFDRVINQATQVLEERLRLKAPPFAQEIGLKLVNAAIKNGPDDSYIRFSDSPSEQEGYASIMRGIVGAFRNTSHHRFMTNVTREQALQICAFIDNLLSALELADVQL